MPARWRARFEGLDRRAFVPREWFAKGNYYALAGRAPFTHLIYPAPADARLGMHLTLDLGGQAKFGPDIEWLDVARPSRSTTRSIRRAPTASMPRCGATGPALPDGALQPELQRRAARRSTARTRSAPDFRIDGPALHGVPGW